MTLPVDQAEGLRRLLRGGRSRVIAFLGIARGAGATTAVATLAASLARSGQQVLLLDEHAPAAHSACALWSLAPRGSLADVAAGRLPLHEAAATAAAGVQVLPAPPAADYDGLHPRTLCPQGTAVIDAELDAEGQLSPLARQADAVVVVMQPSPASITATYAGLKRLRPMQAPQAFHLLVNGAPDEQQARQVITNLARTGSRYLAVSLRPLGWLAADRLVRESGRRHQTVCEAYPGSAAASAYQGLASALLRAAGVSAA